ncbi:MAG: hemolysin family protein [Solirubrobacterales bacterium]
MIVVPLATSLGVGLAAAVLLVVANGFFVATEFALARIRPTQVVDLEAQGVAGAGSLKHASDRIDAYLAACQLGITIASIGLGVVGEEAFHDVFESLFGEGARVVGIAVASGFAFAVITLLHVVLGELAPKSLAISRNRRTALLVATPMRVFYLATKPLVDFFNFLGNLVLKPFGIPPARDAVAVPHSEDELRSLLRESESQGLIDATERRFTERVFTFGDRRVREVMIPRPQVDFVTVSDDLRAISVRAADTTRTRLPMCEEAGLDEPIGLIHVKDLVGAAFAGGETDPRSLARDLARVSESTHIDEVLRTFRRDQQHMGLVLDEHGTTVGLVTLEDILEEIVGEIEDEFDTPGTDLLWWEDAEETVLCAKGSAPTHLVAERLGVVLDDSFEATISGHLSELKGRVPRKGEQLRVFGVGAEVLDVDDTLVRRVRFQQAADRGDGQDAEPEG